MKVWKLAFCLLLFIQSAFAGPRCENILIWGRNDLDSILTDLDFATRLNSYNLKSLEKRLDQSIRDGRFSPDKLRQVIDLVREMSGRDAISFRQLKNRGLRGTTQDLVQTQMETQIFAERLEKALIRADLLKEGEFSYNPHKKGLRQIAFFASIHIGVNAPLFFATGHVMHSPLYLPGFRLPMKAATLTKLLQRSSRVGFNQAYEELKSEVGPRAKAEVAYYTALKAFNMFMIGLLIWQLWEKIDERWHPEKYAIDRAQQQSDIMEDAAVLLVNAKIKDLEEEIKKLTDPDDLEDAKQELKERRIERQNLIDKLKAIKEGKDVDLSMDAPTD